MVNWTNVTAPADLLRLPNENTGGNFWASIIIMLWVVLIIIFSKLGFEISILASSFLMLVLTVLMVYAGLVSWTLALFFLGIILFMFLYIVWSSNRN